MTDAAEQKVILSVTDSRYLTANAAGRVILDALQEDVSFDHLVDLVWQRFGIDKPVAAQDCAAFVADLETRGWLERQDGELVPGFPDPTA